MKDGLASWPDKMEAEHTDLPQDEFPEASNLSLDWAEACSTACRAETW